MTALMTDPVVIRDGLSVRINEELKLISENECMRSLWRFQKNVPPPYTSSSSGDDDDEREVFPSFWRYQRDWDEMTDFPEHVKEIMKKPLTDEELALTAARVQYQLIPSLSFIADSNMEHDRQYVKGYTSRPGTWLERLRRYGVRARHLVKSRWQKLGIWNPEWGFPGRNLKPCDDADEWRWPWESKDADRSAIDKQRYEAVLRALKLRQSLEHEDWMLPPARSRLSPDASATEAEDFLTSRPWFVFRMELEVDRTRMRRYHRPTDKDENMLKRKQRERWLAHRENRCNSAPMPCYWKWRHESPSPEPEHPPPFLPFSISLPSPAISFTASEIEERENINVPRDEQPAGYWTQKEKYVRPEVQMVGQCIDPSTFSRTPSPPPTPPSPRTRLARLGPMPTSRGIFDDIAQWHIKKRKIEADIRAEDEEARRRERAASHEQRRRRKVQSRGQRATAVTPPEADEPPVLRRSQRIAGAKRRAEPLSPQSPAPPAKRARGARCDDDYTHTNFPPRKLRCRQSKVLN